MFSINKEKQQPPLIPVILSGGAGTRLWPVSRRAYPKPFMKLANGHTLAELTIQRALPLAHNGTILTVTSRDYYFITRDLYRGIDGIDMDAQLFLLEPTGRNTAPAIALAALTIAHRFGEDALMLVMPADHLIRNQAAFEQTVDEAIQAAQAGYLTTFGIYPTQPETGYGYIKAGGPITGTTARKVERFVEKPDLATAKKYLASGDYLWNSGMFCWPAGGVLEAFATHAPAVLDAARKCYEASTHPAQKGTVIELDASTFSAMPDISIDYAVMEKADNCAVVNGRFDWNDIGSWNAMAALSECDECGNRVEGKAITIDTRNTYVRAGDRLVATVGVEDLMIVDTSDAVLVAHRDRAQGVKDVVQFLKAHNHDAAVYHQTVHRPWGSYTVLEDADDCKVKRLVVKPGQVLSLQRHQYRSEHWTVVDGEAKVRVGDKEFILKQNQSTYIPAGQLHRLENPTDKDIALIEVQTGSYFGEDDIERLEDIYGRINDDDQKQQNMA